MGGGQEEGIGNAPNNEGHPAKLDTVVLREGVENAPEQNRRRACVKLAGKAGEHWSVVVVDTPVHELQGADGSALNNAERKEE
jgi:hypothetical protein